IVALGPTNNTRSAELVELQFNEPRGAKVANTASTSAAPAFGNVVDSNGASNPNWRTDSGRAKWKGNDAGAGCLARDNVTPYGGKIDTGWAIDIVGSHTIMFWTRTSAAASASYLFGSSTGSLRCYHSGSLLQLLSWGNLPTVSNGTDLDVLTGWHH